MRIAADPVAVWVYLICPLYTDTLVRGVRGVVMLVTVVTYSGVVIMRVNA